MLRAKLLTTMIHNFIGFILEMSAVPRQVDLEKIISTDIPADGRSTHLNLNAVDLQFVAVLRIQITHDIGTFLYWLHM